MRGERRITRRLSDWCRPLGFVVILAGTIVGTNVAKSDTFTAFTSHVGDDLGQTIPQRRLLHRVGFEVTTTDSGSGGEDDGGASKRGSIRALPGEIL